MAYGLLNQNRSLLFEFVAQFMVYVWNYSQFQSYDWTWLKEKYDLDRKMIQALVDACRTVRKMNEDLNDWELLSKWARRKSCQIFIFGIDKCCCLCAKIRELGVEWERWQNTFFYGTKYRQLISLAAHIMCTYNHENVEQIVSDCMAFCCCKSLTILL